MARQKPALHRNWEAAPTLPKGARQKTLCGLQAPQYPYTCQIHAIILTPFSSSHFLSYLKLLQLMGSPPPHYFLLITLLFWLCSPCCSHSLYLPLLLSLSLFVSISLSLCFSPASLGARSILLAKISLLLYLLWILLDEKSCPYPYHGAVMTSVYTKVVEKCWFITCSP